MIIPVTRFIILSLGKGFHESSKHHMLTIIIPTCDRPSQLLAAVNSCRLDNVPGVNVIIVDDGKARPVDPEKFGCEVEIIKTTGYTSAASARNFGAKSAKTDFILFLDDDDCFAENYINEVLELVRKGSYELGVSCTSHTQHKILRTGKNFTKLDLPLKRCIFGAGMGFWIRRSLFLELGGFDEGLRIDEDTHFFCKIRAERISVHVSSTIGIFISPNQVVAFEKTRLTSLRDPKLRMMSYRKTFLAFKNDKRLSLADKYFLFSRFIRVTKKYCMHALFIYLSKITKCVLSDGR